MTGLPFDRYRLHCEPLCPVHVGSGDTIEPFEYVLTDDEWLVAIRMDEFIENLTEAQRREFLSLCDRAQFPFLRKWLREHAGRKRYERFALQVTPEAFRELREHQDDPNRLGEIHLFARHPGTGRPYLPGSSLKGAIRTALVDAGAKAGPGPLLSQAADRRGGQLFEAYALGHSRPDRPAADLYRDPLRQLAISDVALPSDSTYVDRVSVVRRKNLPARPGMADTAGIQMYREMTWSAADQSPLAFSTEVRWHRNLSEARTDPGRITRSWTMEQICSHCNEHYVPVARNELNGFDPPPDLVRPLEDALETLGPLQCIVRVGRHSHFEAVTVSEPYRKPPERGFGGTRTYADGRLPLGWMRLTFTREQ